MDSVPASRVQNTDLNSAKPASPVCLPFNFIMSEGTEFRDKISEGGGGAYRFKQDRNRNFKAKQLSVHPFKIINMKDWDCWDATCRPSRTENSPTPLQKPKSSQVVRRFR